MKQLILIIHRQHNILPNIAEAIGYISEKGADEEIGALNILYFFRLYRFKYKNLYENIEICISGEAEITFWDATQEERVAICSIRIENKG